MMLPGVLRESNENRSYWKGHVLPEVLQSERKQAKKNHCEKMVLHLIKSWQQEGCIQQLYPFKSDGSENKNRRRFLCHWRISSSTPNTYDTPIQDEFSLIVEIQNLGQKWQSKFCTCHDDSWFLQMPSCHCSGRHLSNHWLLLTASPWVLFCLGVQEIQDCFPK